LNQRFRAAAVSAWASVLDGERLALKLSPDSSRIACRISKGDDEEGMGCPIRTYTGNGILRCRHAGILFL
jgi:hypothetical protein